MARSLVCIKCEVIFARALSMINDVFMAAKDSKIPMTGAYALQECRSAGIAALDCDLQILETIDRSGQFNWPESRKE
jgi:hypothetical protein